MILLFDIGGSRMRIAISRDGKTISDPVVHDTPQDVQAAALLLKRTADMLAKGEKITICAGGIPSPQSSIRSEIYRVPHLPAWAGKPIKEIFEKALDAPVFLENDAMLAALGEAHNGAGAGVRIVAYITIGTGVGGARTVDGRQDASSFGFEIGHQIIHMDGVPCVGCGGKGHLEAYVSGSGIEKRYGRKAEEIEAAHVWDEVYRALAVGLNNVIVHWSPDIIILGGSLGLSHRISTQRLEEYVRDLLTIFPEQPKIVKARLGDRAGLMGGLQIIRQNI